MLGPRAKFERYAADMLRIIASKKSIDLDQTKRLADILEPENPFEEKKPQMNANDIKAHIISRIRELRGSPDGFNDISSQANA